MIEKLKPNEVWIANQFNTTTCLYYTTPQPQTPVQTSTFNESIIFSKINEIIDKINELETKVTEGST